MQEPLCIFSNCYALTAINPQNAKHVFSQCFWLLVTYKDSPIKL